MCHALQSVQYDRPNVEARIVFYLQRCFTMQQRQNEACPYVLCQGSNMPEVQPLLASKFACLPRLP